MDKRYQIVGELKDKTSSDVLEAVDSREEAEYALAHYLLYSNSKYLNLHILEVGNANIKE